MVKYIIGMTMLVSSLFTLSAAEIIVNGDFETGTFAGWNVGSTQSSPFQAGVFSSPTTDIAKNDANTANAWAVKNVAANYWGPANPIAGHSAFNGFDGSPGYFHLSQDFAYSSSSAIALLNFDYAIQSSYSGSPRVFSVNLLDSLGGQVANFFTFAQPTGSQTAWNPVNQSLDVSSFFTGLAADTYTLQFKIDIPSNYTGPAQFAIDNVSFDVTPSAIPEPSTYALLAMGLLGLCVHRRKLKK